MSYRAWYENVCPDPTVAPRKWGLGEAFIIDTGLNQFFLDEISSWLDSDEDRGLDRCPENYTWTCRRGGRQHQYDFYVTISMVVNKGKTQIRLFYIDEVI